MLGVLAYTGTRIGAVAKLLLADYPNRGDHLLLCFREKGGKDLRPTAHKPLKVPAKGLRGKAQYDAYCVIGK
jgi:hypothetical protein